VIATVPIGQAPQAIAYVPNAVPQGEGRQGLQPLGVAGEVAHLVLVPVTGGAGGGGAERAPTSVSLFDQGLLQVLQASVTGLRPKQPYVLALSNQANGEGVLEPLAGFTTNPAGSGIVDAVGPIRQIVQGEDKSQRRYLVIVSGTPGQLGAPVQVEASR
jgi:hypothetical protein